MENDNMTEAKLWDALRLGAPLARKVERQNLMGRPGIPFPGGSACWEALRLVDGKFVITNEITGCQREAKAADVQLLEANWEPYHWDEFSYSNPDFVQAKSLALKMEVEALHSKVDWLAAMVSDIMRGGFRLVPDRGNRCEYAGDVEGED